MRVKFVVPGEPQGKGRPRFRKAGNYVSTYTPKGTVVYENLVKVEYQSQANGYRFPDDAYLEMNVRAFYAIPKSVSKKRKGHMISALIRPTKKPDVSNVLKAVEDGLNGIAYRDDAQIVDTRISKYYSEKPCVVVEIRQIEGGMKNAQ